MNRHPGEETSVTREVKKIGKIDWEIPPVIGPGGVFGKPGGHVGDQSTKELQGCRSGQGS